MSSLLPNDHRKGNPNWSKGKSANPNGKPKGTKNRKTLLDKVNDRLKYKHKLHPVDQLVTLAMEARMDKKLDLAADIWVKLLQYMEPTKKPVESVPDKPQTPEQSKEAAEATLKLLEELSNGPTPDQQRSQGSSNSPSLETGATDLQA